MISVCSTIYNQPENLERFVRSLVGNASDKNFEIVIVDDENSCQEKLNELSKEFPQLKVIPRPKKDRVKFAQGLIDFYRKEKIFNDKILQGMDQNLSKYKKGGALWLPMAHNYNLAVKKSKGDMLVIMPSDYLVFFDVSKLQEGHLDWIDLTVFEPDFNSTTEEILGKAMSLGVPVIFAQHGSRMVSRAKFDEVGGFDERWFVRALYDDLFNSQTGVKRLVSTILHITSPYIGNLRSGNKYFNYLSPDYDINAENHEYFVERIKEWLQTT